MLSRPLRWFLYLLVLGILVGYVLYPSLETFRLALVSSALQQYLDAWSSVHARAFMNSILLSLLTVGGAGALGTGMAYFFFRYLFPLRRIGMVVASWPLALPPLVGVLAFLFLYGESGILPGLMRLAWGSSLWTGTFEGLPAVLVVHIYAFYVYFYLLVLAALHTLDRNVLEAAEDLGASGRIIFRRIILPLLLPSLRNAALLVFMLSMGSFTAPLLFGGTEPFLTVQIFQYKTNGNLNVAALISIILTLINLIFLLVLEWRASHTHGQASKGTVPLFAIRPSPLWQVFFSGLTFLVLLFVLLPIGLIVLLSFAREGSWTTQLLPTAYTLENYARILRDPAAFLPIWNSLRLSLLATGANLLLGVVTALFLTRFRMPGRFLLHVLSMLPFAIPGTVIAVNLIAAFNRPSPLSLGSVLVGTFWILPLAYFIRNIPLIVRSTASVLERFDDRLAEASEDLGASPWHTFRKVVLPLVGPGILAGSLLTFVTAMGEFVASVMLYVYDNRPISVEIFSRLRLYDFGGAAAYSVFLMVMIMASSLIVRRIGKRQTEDLLIL